MNPPDSSSCPSTEALEAFSRGRLADNEQGPLLQHLSFCQSCQELFQKLTTQKEKFAAGGKVLPGGLPAGSMLGQYQLLEPIGRGGMGVVYKAMHSKLRQVVALKTMTRTALLDPQAIARFQREMAALGALVHPNIVRATDAGEWDGWHYLVIEYLEGIDLNHLVQVYGTVSVADACELVRQAATGLQFIHEHQRVHRDLKPSNLMLTVTGQVKILDLGLALLNEAHDQDELTGSHQVMGTAYYIAPEQARNSHQVDIRADLYSLGCTLFKLLTGTVPLPQAGNGRRKQLHNNAGKPGPMLASIRSDVPRGVVDIVEKLLADDPEARYPEPAALVTSLSPFAQGSQLQELVRVALEKRASQAKEAVVSQQYETIPFRQMARGMPGVKSAPTPILAEPLPKPAVRTWKRLAVALGLALLLLFGVWWTWDRFFRNEVDALPWPADYPETLKHIRWEKPVALVDKRPWRPRDPLDTVRGNINDDGLTFQPLWRRRILGQGLYYETNLDLHLAALEPPSITFLELNHDLRRPWFEVEMELMSLEAATWVGGVFVGWREQQSGLAKTYLLFLERGLDSHRLHLAPVAVRRNKDGEAAAVFPFIPLDKEKIHTLEAPLVHRFNRVRLRATQGKLRLDVEGGKSATIDAPFDPRGSLGLWVQTGFAYCGRILYTPLRVSPTD